MALLREFTNAILADSAGVASLNACRWLVQRYERERLLH
jgi:hypothetical protein